MKHIGTKAIRDVGGELLSKTVVEQDAHGLKRSDGRLPAAWAGIFVSRSRSCFYIGAVPRVASEARLTVGTSTTPLQETSRCFLQTWK